MSNNNTASAQNSTNQSQGSSPTTSTDYIKERVNTLLTNSDVYTDSLNRQWIDMRDSSNNIHTYQLGGQAFNDALAVHADITAPTIRQEVTYQLQARARISGKEKVTFNRIGFESTGSSAADTVYYEALGDLASTVIAYSKDGCSIHPVSEPLPVVLETSRNQKALAKHTVTPTTDAELLKGIDTLRKHLSILNDAQIPQLVALLTLYKMPNHKAPIAVFSGESDSGKTTIAKFVTSLIDPNKKSGQPQQHGTKSLQRALAAGYATTMHNATRISVEDQNLLCTAYDDGEGSEDMMRTNGEVFDMNLKGPVIMSMINDQTLSERDSRSRSVFFNVVRDKTQSREDDDIEREQEHITPEIQALLRGLVVYCLKNWHTVDGKFDNTAHRNVAFTRIYELISRLMGNTVSYREAVKQQQDALLQMSLQESLLAQDLVSLFGSEFTQWTGKAKYLKILLQDHVGDAEWSKRIESGEYANPSQSTQFAKRLADISSILESAGITYRMSETKINGAFDHIFTSCPVS